MPWSKLYTIYWICEKENFKSIFPDLCNSREHFIKHSVFDHGESHGKFPNVFDNHHLCIVAAAFIRAIMEQECVVICRFRSIMFNLLDDPLSPDDHKDLETNNREWNGNSPQTGHALWVPFHLEMDEKSKKIYLWDAG